MAWISSAVCPFSCAGEVFEVGARDLVQLERKRVCGQLVEGRGELVDRVVGARPRAVAAGIGRRDLVVGIDFFGGLHIGDHGRPWSSSTPPESGLMTYAASTRSRCCCTSHDGAVELAAFFIGGQGQDQVALRLVAFPVQAQKCGDQRGVGVFHVLGAAPIEVAALLHELERIGVPVGAQSLHDIDDGRETGRAFATVVPAAR